MKFAKKWGSSFLLLGTLTCISPSAMAEKFCAPLYENQAFQVALIDWEDNGMCIYSSEAMYLIGRGLAPVTRQSSSRWRNGHGGWYCRPTTKDPLACQFKLASLKL